MQQEEVRSPAQIASTLSLIIVQSVFLYSFFYWFGFSAVSHLSIIRYFSLLEIFTGVADGRLTLLLVMLLANAILHTSLIAWRERRIGFIDDTSVKVPPLHAEQTSANTASNAKPGHTKRAERYMTRAELGTFLHWLRLQRFVRWQNFSLLLISFAIVSYLWISGKRAEAIYMSTFVISFASALLAVSNVWAFVNLSVRNALSAVLYICSLSASLGAYHATDLLKGRESVYFPEVHIKFESGISTGKLVLQTSSTTLVFDALRRFAQLPTGKIVELKYVPQ